MHLLSEEQNFSYSLEINKEDFFFPKDYIISNVAFFSVFHQLLDSLRRVSIPKNLGKTKLSLLTRK